MKTFQKIQTAGSTKKILLRFIIVIFVLLFIQGLNQILILSGSTLERFLLSAQQNPRIWVGIFQQLTQASVGILLSFLLLKKKPFELGINTKNKSISFRYFAIFAAGWISLIILYLIVTYFFFPQSWITLRTTPPQPPAEFYSTIFFQSIFPGLGEEILFRGFLITLLTQWVFPDYEKNIKARVAVIGLTGFYFAIAHIYYSLSPFQVTHFDLQQVLTALGCGWFYAAAYLKTRSLLAPFLAHNFANTTATICAQILSSI